MHALSPLTMSPHLVCPGGCDYWDTVPEDALANLALLYQSIQP
jgi:hypothetical protein